MDLRRGLVLLLAAAGLAPQAEACSSVYKDFMHNEWISDHEVKSVASSYEEGSAWIVFDIDNGTWRPLQEPGPEGAPVSPWGQLYSPDGLWTLEGFQRELPWCPTSLWPHRLAQVDNGPVAHTWSLGRSFVVDATWLDSPGAVVVDVGNRTLSIVRWPAPSSGDLPSVETTPLEGLPAIETSGILQVSGTTAAGRYVGVVYFDRYEAAVIDAQTGETWSIEPPRQGTTILLAAENQAAAHFLVQGDDWVGELALDGETWEWVTVAEGFWGEYVSERSHFVPGGFVSHTSSNPDLSGANDVVQFSPTGKDSWEEELNATTGFFALSVAPDGRVVVFLGQRSGWMGTAIWVVPEDLSSVEKYDVDLSKPPASAEETDTPPDGEKGTKGAPGPGPGLVLVALLAAALRRN